MEKILFKTKQDDIDMISFLDHQDSLIISILNIMKTIKLQSQFMVAELKQLYKTFVANKESQTIKINFYEKKLHIFSK